MVPWGEILECYNLDIWILVLDLKKQIEARLKWKTIILGADSRKQSPLLLNGDFGCYLQKLH